MKASTEDVMLHGSLGDDLAGLFQSVMDRVYIKKSVSIWDEPNQRQIYSTSWLLKFMCLSTLWYYLFAIETQKDCPLAAITLLLLNRHQKYLCGLFT